MRDSGVSTRQADVSPRGVCRFAPIESRIGVRSSPLTPTLFPILGERVGSALYVRRGWGNIDVQTKR